MQAKYWGIISSIFIMLVGTNVNAGRNARSAEVREKAEAWCAEYTRLHDGAECHVVRKIKLCPKGFRKEKTFKKLRANDYKTCIRGSKMHVVKRAAKKAVNVVQGAPILPVGGLVLLYKKYFKRIDRHAKNSRKLPDNIITEYQRFFRNDLKKVRVAESSKVYPGNAMTDCNQIYFPVGRLDSALSMSGGKATKWLLHELWHTNQCYQKGGRNNYAAMWFRREAIGMIKALAGGDDKLGKRIHDKNPMEKDADKNAQRIRSSATLSD